MRAYYGGAVCCAVLLAIFAFKAPLQAAASNSPAPAAEPAAILSPRNDDIFTERQALREERASIRADHEALEADREKVKVQCLDAKGQDKSACEAQREQLRARREALEQRVKILHEKILADQAEARRNAAASNLPPMSPPPVATPVSAPTK